MRTMLGAYQFVDSEPMDPEAYEQFGPNALKIQLNTPMDVQFMNRKVTALLSEKARRELAAVLLEGLER